MQETLQQFVCVPARDEAKGLVPCDLVAWPEAVNLRVARPPLLFKLIARPLESDSDLNPKINSGPEGPFVFGDVVFDEFLLGILGSSKKLGEG